MLPDPLPPELASFVQAEVASGRFPSEQAVFVAGVRLLQERDRKLSVLRRDVQEAIDEVDRGEGLEMTDEALTALVEEISQTGRRRLNASS